MVEASIGSRSTLTIMSRKLVILIFSEHFVVLVDLELQSSVSIKIYKISMF